MGYSWRGDAEFHETFNYAMALDALPREARATISDAVLKFRNYWNVSASFSTGQLPAGFKFKTIFTVPGKYKIHQITAGRDYRVAFMKVSHDKDVYLIGCWKKTKQNNSREVDKAKKNAVETWTKLFGGSRA